MISKEKIEAVLRYYKHEDECPFEYGTKEHFFWHSERDFLSNSLMKDEFYQSWVNEADKYSKKHSQEHNQLTDSKTPEATKAIIIYTDAMLDKWAPQNSEWIFEY